MTLIAATVSNVHTQGEYGNKIPSCEILICLMFEEEKADTCFV